MKQIKFRGKDAITGNWAYGYYYPSKGHDIIRNEKDEECIVLGKSVCQFTGLQDKNGKEIYEGDIVKWLTIKFDFNNPDDILDAKRVHVVSEIVYRGHGFWVKDESFGWEGETLWNWDEMKVIGNVYENPELIK